MSVYKKIALVMQDVHYLQKDDQVAFGNTKYKAISEEKVTMTVREAMNTHGLVIIPVEQEHQREPILNKDGETKGFLTTVNVKYKIVDIDTGDSIEAVSSGTGVDTQDKGVGKAMTYAYKYLLLRTFAIPTGEDPDKISSAELDSKQDRQVGNPELPDKQRIITVLSKWEALGYGDAKAFEGWLLASKQKKIEDLTVQDIVAIEQTLTKKLMDKKGAH